MASYSAVIDVRVNGVQGLKTVEDRIKSIQNIQKQLKPIPSIFDKRTSKELKEAKEELSAYVIAAGKGANGSRDLANTLAGLSSQVKAFNTVAANASRGSDEFTGALNAAERASIKLKNAEVDRLNVLNRFYTPAKIGGSVNVKEILNLGKTIPKSISGLEFYQRELQETLRLVDIGSRDFTTLSLAIADVNEQLARTRNIGRVQGPQILDANGFPVSSISQNKAREKARTAAATSRNQNLAAGIGFPLLFGGGPGSVLGGALGAALGGFGGSILGSAIGQQLDALGAAALSTAKAFDSLGDTASDLVKILGAGRRGGLGATAEFLISEGLSSSVADILRRRFDEQFGAGTADTFQQISDTGKDLDDSLQAIGISLQKLMSGPLRGIANILGGLTPPPEVTPREANIRKQRSLQQQINFFDQLEKRERPAGGDAKVLTDFQEERRKKLKEQLKILQAQEGSLSNLTDAEKELNELLNQRINKTKELQALQTDLVRTQLTARRDDRAFAENNLVIATLESDLAITRAELEKEKSNNSKTSLRARQLENKEIKQSAALERARLKQANDVALAKRRITKEELQNQIATAAAFTQSVAVQRQLQDLSRSEAESYKTVNDFIQGNLQTREEVLGIQKQIELSGKTEQEVIDAIVFKYAALVELERDRAKLKEEQARQAEILRQIEELRFRQSLAQATSDTRRSAEEQIRGTDPFRAFEFAGAGLGFFADSEQFQADRIAAFNAQLERYNELIAAQQQIVAKGEAEGLDTEAFLADKRTLEKLQRARSDFERFQPAIDKAAVAQTRFNDALAAVSPGVNTLVGGLQEIVAGTKTAQEVFSDFLKTIADQLVQNAAKMIATYIALGIARAFAFGGGGGSFGQGVNSGLPLFGDYSDINLGGFGAFAEGGYVTGPTNALIGEGGEPEYVIPESKMRESMARYARGSRGSSVIPAEGGTTSGEGGTAVAAPIDVRYSVERINNVDYVTAEEFQAGMRQAAAQGAQRGQQLTLTRLQQSPTTRRRLGL